MKGTMNRVTAGRIIDKAKNISFRLEDFMNGIENAWPVVKHANVIPAARELHKSDMISCPTPTWLKKNGTYSNSNLNISLKKSNFYFYMLLKFDFERKMKAGKDKIAYLARYGWAGPISP